jgi:hypothetical protein
MLATRRHEGRGTRYGRPAWYWFAFAPFLAGFALFAYVAGAAYGAVIEGIPDLCLILLPGIEREAVEWDMALKGFV